MVQFCSVALSCLTLCDPKDYRYPKSLGSRTAARQASLSITNSQSLLKLMSIELVMQFSLCLEIRRSSRRMTVKLFPESPEGCN